MEAPVIDQVAVIVAVASSYVRGAGWMVEHRFRKGDLKGRTLGKIYGLAFLWTLVIAPEFAAAQRPLNLDFELPSAAYPHRPWGWTLGWSAFAGGPAAEFVLDTVRMTGRHSLRITASDTLSDPPARGMVLQLPGTSGHGRTLRLTGHLRTRDLAGRALVLLEAWGDRVVIAGDTASVTSSAAHWTQFDLRIAVPNDPSIHSVVATTAVEGAGTAWFDQFVLELDGEPVTALPADAPAPTPAGIQWLAERSQPIRTVTPLPAGAPSDPDLALLSRIIGSASIVGLGESTHGTREFFQVKHRILEYLVREHRFDLFAIEANQLAVERLNAWVLGGPGTVRDAMRVLFRVWNTEEMQALVEWARAYNQARPSRPLHFVGYDMQDHRTPVDSLRAFLARVEPGILPQFEAWTAEYRAQSYYATGHMPDSTRALWHRQADSLRQAVVARRSEWLRSAAGHADSLAVEWAAQNAELFRQAARFNVALSSPERDSLMAANLDWAVRTLYPGARTMVWAHDVHVSHGGDAVRSFNAGAQMGAHLKHSYGHDYRSFSLLTRAGSYSATRSFTDHEIIAAEAFPAPPGSIEAALAAVPRPPGSLGLVTDLRSDPRNPRAAWLWRARPIRHVGYAVYDYGFEMRAVMPLEFDGVILIERSEASRILP